MTLRTKHWLCLCEHVESNAKQASKWVQSTSVRLAAGNLSNSSVDGDTAGVGAAFAMCSSTQLMLPTHGWPGSCGSQQAVLLVIRVSMVACL